MKDFFGHALDAGSGFGRIPHPDSFSGVAFDWSTIGLPHPRSPAGQTFDWSSVGLPHPHSPAGDSFDWSALRAPAFRRHRSSGKAQRAPAVVKQGSDITEGRFREAMKGATLKTQMPSVSLPMIRQYAEMILAGKPVPAVKVDRGIIVEGTHRYAASRIARKEPIILVATGGRIDRVVPWERVKVETLDW